MTATTTTAARGLAAACWKSNLDALTRAQPRLAAALRDQQIHVSEWLFARDGSLTAFTGPGRWWTGCSLPHRAASAMLKTLEVSGVVGCLLDPPHAAHVRVALDKLRWNQAVVAVCPDPPQLALLLHCEDFTADLGADRLFFAWGNDWPAELAKLLDEHAGLPTPSAFVRLPVHDDAAIEQLVKTAQDVFTAETARRAAVVRAARLRPAPAASATPKVAVIAPSGFRLWDDAAGTLAAALGGSARVLDTDVPTSASPLALLAATDGCDALVTGDLARADAPNLLPDALPWVTWVTTSRIPAYVPAAPGDALLLADARLLEDARCAGWPDARLAVAGWPSRANAPTRATGSPVAALITDTKPLAPPKRLDDYSSHRLLWEQIVAELLTNPFAALDDPDAYLTARQRRAGIDDAAVFDRRLFCVDLIAPAVAQGLARALLAAEVPLRLHGAGWQAIEEFAPVAAGPVASREAFESVLANCAVLIDARATAGPHPMHACGRRVVRATRAGVRAFVDAIYRPSALAAPERPLTAELIMSLIRR